MVLLETRAAPLNDARPSTKQIQKPRSRVGLTLKEVSTVFHIVVTVFFTYVWLWHLTPAAGHLKGATEYGWFFRYLTFCSFTAQTLQLLSATLADLHEDTSLPIRRLTDDLACLVFVTANTVTIMYYSLEAITENLSEGPRENMVMWVNHVVHSANTIVVWMDLLLCHPRSFSPRAQRWTIFFAAGYCAWILNVKAVGGRFPYPFLDALPFPRGFLLVCSSGVLVIFLMFCLGRFLSGRITVWIGKGKECGEVEVRGEIKVD